MPNTFSHDPLCLDLKDNKIKHEKNDKYLVTHLVLALVLQDLPKDEGISVLGQEKNSVYMNSIIR
jgi:hypothetical protein